MFHFSAALGLVLLFYNNKPLDNLRMWILRCVLPVGLLLYAIKFNVFSIIPGFIGGFKMEVYKSQAETGMMSSASLVDDPLILLRMFVFGYTLYFYNTMMAEIREALDNGSFEKYKKCKLDSMSEGYV